MRLALCSSTSAVRTTIIAAMANKVLPALPLFTLVFIVLLCIVIDATLLALVDALLAR